MTVIMESSTFLIERSSVIEELLKSEQNDQTEDPYHFQKRRLYIAVYTTNQCL